MTNQKRTKTPAPRRRTVGAGLATGLIALTASAVLLIGVGRPPVSAAGSSGPQQALERLVEAVNSEDLLGVVAALAPDEVPDLDQVVEQLQAEADEVGVSFGADADLDAEIVLRDITVRDEGDNAAIVGFALDGSLDASRLQGALGDLLPDGLVEFTTDDLLGSYVAGAAITEVFVVTVKIDGDWYVSPMLTAGEYVVRALNLLPGDYAEIGETVPAGAATGPEAVAALLAGAADLDIDAVSDVLSPGLSRFATVFEDAIEDLLFEVPPDLLSGVEVDARELDGGGVHLNELSFLVTYYDEWEGYTTSVGVELDDDCLTLTDFSDGERSRGCLSRIQPYYEPSDGGLVFATAGEPGAVTVDLVGTVTALALDVITQVDWDRAVRSTDLALYLEPQPVAAPSETVLAFDGSPSRVVEFEVAPGSAYTVAVDGEYGDSSVFVRDDDGRWREEWDDVLSFEVATPVRVLITSESACNDFYCERTGTGDFTLRVGLVDRVAADFPSELTGELDPGETMVFDLTVAADHFLQIDVTEAGGSESEYLSWYLERADDGISSYVELPTVPAGRYVLLVENRSDAGPVSFVVTATEVEPAGFAGSSSATVNLSSGSASLDGTTTPSQWIWISAVPAGSQDIVLYVYDGNEMTLCSADDGYGGAPEECAAQVDASGRFRVEVRGYSPADNVGEVVVYYEQG